MPTWWIYWWKVIWLSLKPIGWEKKVDEDTIDKVLWQYKTINKKIESEISENDTIIANYEDICDNPHRFLRKVRGFVKCHEINLELRLDNIPDSLKISKVNPDKDDLSRQISKLLNE